MRKDEAASRIQSTAGHVKPGGKTGGPPSKDVYKRQEHDRLEQEYKTGQAELSPIYAEVKKLWQIKYKVEQVVRAQENPEQSRRKQHQIDH